MNDYLKSLLVLSVLVGLLCVGIQEVLERYEAEISDVLKENPSLRVASEALQKMSLNKLLFSLVNYFPSLRGSRPLGQPFSAATKDNKAKKEKLFTVEQLRKYDGKDGNKGPYVAILGRVYDVRKGRKHYGPGGGYEFFSGRDASRAFVSGDFTPSGLTDDVSGLTGPDYIGLDEWLSFYETDYKFVGKVIGRYYDENGQPTQHQHEVQKRIGQAYSARENDSQEKRVFPPCNSEWSPDAGSRLWCTKRSGGIDREWVGVPRQLFTPGRSKSRCACVKTFGPPSHDPTRHRHENRGDLDHPNLKEYPGCPPDEPECFVKLD